ncbi:hypothetical protein ACLOJK_027899 [Asimina triloba]
MKLLLKPSGGFNTQHVPQLMNMPISQPLLQTELSQPSAATSFKGTPQQSEGMLLQNSVQTKHQQHEEQPELPPPLNDFLPTEDGQAQFADSLPSLPRHIQIQEKIAVESSFDSSNRGLREKQIEYKKDQLLYNNMYELSQLVQQQMEPNIGQPQQTEEHPLGVNNVNNLLPCQNHIFAPYLDTGDLLSQASSFQSPMDVVKSSTSVSTLSSSAVNMDCFNPTGRLQFSCLSNSDLVCGLPPLDQDLLSMQQLSYMGCLTQIEQNGLGISSSGLKGDICGAQEQDPMAHLQSVSNSCGFKDLPEDSNNQSDSFNNPPFEVSNASTLIDPSISSACLDSFGSLRDAGFRNPSEGPIGNFSSAQDVSQVTSASLADSQGFSFREFTDNLGGTSSSNVDVDENSFLQNGAWKQVPAPLRTYTKVQKLGSVGRSIDVTRFKDYSELKSAIACMFGLEGQLDDLRGSGWKLVYVDYENDVLLVGDDPWEEFVSCVRCIRILSPSEVQQMSEEGMKLLNNTMIQGKNISPEGGLDVHGGQ